MHANRFGLKGVTAIAVAMVSLAACGGTAADLQRVSSSALDEPIEIVTTAYPLFDAAQSVGGNRVKVTNLLPVGSFANEPLSAEKREELISADLVIDLGDGTQPELDKILDISPVRQLSVLELMDTLPANGRPGTADPNVWMDPTRMAEVVSIIDARLAQADPAGAQTYRARAIAYRSRLADVDYRYAHTLAGCERRDLVTEQPDFAYLANRYDLTYVRTSAFGPAPLTGEPLRAVKQNYKVTTIVAAELPSSRAARRLYRTDGLRVSVLDALNDRTEQARGGGADYFTVMKLNLDALQEALECTNTFDDE